MFLAATLSWSFSEYQDTATAAARQQNEEVIVVIRDVSCCCSVLMFRISGYYDREGTITERRGGRGDQECLVLLLRPGLLQNLR